MSIIHEFNRNSQEKVRIQLQEYRGNEYVDVRIYYDNSGGRGLEWLPTQKGIKIKPDLLPELIEGLSKALRELEKAEKMHEKPQDGRSAQD